jgi:hypothetical protein
VDNPLAFPVESETVQVSLLEADGSVYRSERSTVEQPSIPSGSFAPYQATFEAAPDDFGSTDARLIGAVRGAAEHFVLLVIGDVRGELVNGRLIVRATVSNPGAKDAEITRAFVTLLDSGGSVIGYRVVTFEAGIRVDAGAQLPLTIELAPQAADLTPQYALYVEARAVME